jgi:ATP-dependent RNA helicase DeaD
MIDIQGIAAPLAAALADKGYDSLTPVQRAVLTPDTAGRDLLVSAQTGSGKTVAFGLAIAPQILAEAPPAAADLGAADLTAPVPGADAAEVAGARPPRPAPPRGLIVAPTRELALQVQREIEWLYAGTGLTVASCVGGMDFRTERRALDRGAAIVVGTPGRLRDHLERGTLDLSGLRAAVLDEADEMLDLGFSDDLEFILGAAPADRRTMMFSATVPRAIEALAATYQRDALRVVAAGEARQHGDIAYRALSVAARDKEAAVFNLLRHDDARVAIVFAKTRAAVSHLAARMGNRGFAVVALSGELSQGERTHALMALRDGRARVCIATDVAARGIDLPGLDLVVHFDLPSNSEVLLHRSGRTGRAGAKGTSVLIVTPAEYRKAQRLLQGAQVSADWGTPPSAEEVQAADDARLLSDPAFAAPGEDEAEMAAALLAAHGPEAVAAAALRLWRAGRSAPEVLGDVAPPAAGERAAVVARAAARAEFGPSVWLRLSVGHEGRAEARWLLPKLCDAGGITKDAIGAIRVQDDETFVQIAEGSAGGFVDGAELAPGLTLTLLKGEPDLTRGARRSAPPAPDRRSDAPRPRSPRAADAGPPRPRPTRPQDAAARTERRAPARPAWTPDRAPDPAPEPPRDTAPPAPRAPDARPDAAAAAPQATDAPRKTRWTKDDPRRTARDAGGADRPRPAPRGDAPEGARPPRARPQGDARPAPWAGKPARPAAASGKPARGPGGPAGTDRPPRKGAPADRSSAPYARKPAAAGDAPRPARAPAAKPDFSDPGVSLRKPAGRAGAKPRPGAKPGAKPGPRTGGKPGPKPGPRGPKPGPRGGDKPPRR